MASSRPPRLLQKSARAVAGTMFIVGFGAALNDRLKTRLGAYIAAGGAKAGLPATSPPDFSSTLLGTHPTAVGQVAGVTPAIIAGGLAGMRQAFADSPRVIWNIVTPFGAVACIACLFTGHLRKTMNYRVDALAEKLHARTRATVVYRKLKRLLRFLLLFQGQQIYQKLMQVCRVCTSRRRPSTAECGCRLWTTQDRKLLTHI